MSTKYPTVYIKIDSVQNIKRDCGRNSKNGKFFKRFEEAQDLSAYKTEYSG